MRLSQTAITEFRELYRKKMGVRLDDDKANDLGVELLKFFQLIYRPIPINNSDRVTGKFADVLREEP